MPFVFWWTQVTYPAFCFTFWLIASWWCDLTCSSVPCVSQKLRSRGLIRVAFDFWPEAFVDGVVQPLLYHILMSSCLSLKVAQPALLKELPAPISISMAIRTCFAKQASWEHWSYRADVGAARSCDKCTDLEQQTQRRGWISLCLGFPGCKMGLRVAALRTNWRGKCW